MARDREEVEVTEEETVDQDTSIIDELDAQEVPEVPTTTEEVEVAPVDADAGFNVIDRMVASGTETEFCVSQNGHRSYLTYDFGANLAEMAEKFGEEVVANYAKANMIVKAQAVTRPFIGKGLSAEGVINDWIPGVKRVAGPVDKKAAASDYVDSAPVGELEEMLAAITAKIAAKNS